VSNTGVQVVRLGRRFLPISVVILGGILLAVGYAQTPLQRVADTTTDSTRQAVSETPAPKLNSRHVTVNGREVPTASDGSASITTPFGETKVDVSDGQTKVTTTQSKSTKPSHSSDGGNVNVTVNSSNTAGSGFGSTQVFGLSSGTTTNGSSSSFSSTSVFSSDTAHVVTTTP
jgi:hypothetical protein